MDGRVVDDLDLILRVIDEPLSTMGPSSMRRKRIIDCFTASASQTVPS